MIGTDGVRFGMRTAALVLLALATTHTASADQFTKPTPEELAMKELPGYPGAPAVVLFREEITKDDLHVVQHYDRIKVLTEEGKKYANVELSYFSTSDDGFGFSGDDKTLGEIAGRTIHPDGTIIPFTGKPYKKTLEKGKGIKYQAIVFTLPDVEVGSILEYRYNSRINDNIFEAPSWYIQGDLYLKAAHYEWFPTVKPLVDSKERSINSITWFPILPAGAKIVRTELPAHGFEPAQQTYDLVVKDVPPQVKEDYMPPISSWSYRVLFNMQASRTFDEYWKDSGKEWSKRVDSFSNPNGDLNKATAAITAGATTQDEKLRKIYAAVMALENTSYTRAHEQTENKAAGVGKLNHVSDLLKLNRGNSTQIAELFVGMARAAGMKAYLMLVPDRSEELFTEAWLSFEQFDATIAIVNLDGKDVFFDPGSRYCPYGHLAWEHTMVKGLRQIDGGTAFANTPGDSFNANKTIRVANLQMAEDGAITGKIDLSFTGSPALDWRHRALRGDNESLKEAMRTSLEEMLPKTLEVKVTEIKDLDAYEKPLGVSYDVTGHLGTPTGKRLVLPVDLFEAGTTAAFPHEKRELAVYFRYPQVKQDALRINFTKGFAIEAVPDAAKYSIPTRQSYNLTVESTPTSFTTRRTYAVGDVLVTVPEYPELRKFYTQLESKDQESVVLKIAPTQTASASATPD